MLYDKTGAAFELDHQIDGVSYVRPMVKVVMQSATYSGDDFHEEEAFEPADFLVARNTSELFDAPPIAQVDGEIKAKREELRAFIADAKRQEREAQEAKRKAERELFQAKRDLERWRAEHKVMSDLGRLLDGATLYPLTIQNSSYHNGPDIPIIPNMRNASYLQLSGGNWETGKSWSCKNYASDGYGYDFRFYDTEEERAEAIKAAFDRACDAFRKAPNFSDEGRTYSTRLDFGRLSKWIEAHPTLRIPEDIVAAKSADDEAKLKARRAKLAAELAGLEAKP
jgi:hypothetical protein